MILQHYELGRARVKFRDTYQRGRWKSNATLYKYESFYSKME